MGHPNLPSAGGKEIEINHDTLDDIATKLDNDLKELKDARLSAGIIGATPPEASMGDYQAGRSMYATVTAARDQIGNTLDGFITAYEQVIEAIRMSNKNYRTADDNSQQTAENAGNPYTAI